MRETAHEKTQLVPRLFLKAHATLTREEHMVSSGTIANCALPPKLHTFGRLPVTQSLLPISARAHAVSVGAASVKQICFHSGSGRMQNPILLPTAECHVLAAVYRC